MQSILKFGFEIYLLKQHRHKKKNFQIVYVLHFTFSQSFLLFNDRSETWRQTRKN